LTRPNEHAASNGALSLALAFAALLVAVYLAFQIIGLVFKLLFLVAAVLIARWAVRAWRSSA
jgi:hypothetical protein